jgi:predicted transcriptional regulator
MIRQWLHNWKIQRRRKKVFNVVKRHPEGVAMFDIANETGYDTRRVNAILTVLTKKGLIFSIYTDEGKRWRAV